VLLYTRADAERCLAQLVAVDFHARFEPARGLVARFTRAGHILDAACLALDPSGCSIGFPATGTIRS
jgi:metallo-beta-lactamase family protein